MVEILAPVVRGLILATLLVLVGTATSLLLVRRAGLDQQSSQAMIIGGWLSRLPGLFAWFLLTLWLLRGALQVLAFTDPGMPIDPELARIVLGTGSWGVGWLVGAVLAFALLSLSWLLRAAPIGLLVLTWSTTIGLLLAQAGMGHGVDPFWSPLLLGRAVHFTHLLGGGLWLGTLAVLSMAVFPSLLDSRDHGRLTRILDNFSKLARAGGALVVLSGAVAALVYTDAVADLWTTTWGRLLCAKLVVVAAIAAAGYRNWRVITPKVAAAEPESGAALRRTIQFELLLAAAAIALTAVLSGSATPRE